MTDLTEKQIRTIEALYTSTTVQEAAARSGVHPDSISRWKRSPEFRQAYARARREMLGETTAKLTAVGAAVVESLVGVALDTQAPHAARVSAGRTLLTMAYKSAEQLDITARLERIEQEIAGVAVEEE